MLFIRRPGVALLMSVASAAPLGAQAQMAAGAPLPVPTDPAACARLEKNEDRLACYDRLYRPAPQAATAVDPPSQQAASPLAVTPVVSAALPVAVQEAPNPADPCARRLDATSSLSGYLGSTLSERWELSCRDQFPAFLPRPYRPVYLLPISWTSRVNRMPQGASASPDNAAVQALDLDKNEAKFQISLKSKIWSLDDDGSLSVWGAYTQSSRWQVFNGRVSRPFRETNYEPEIILTHGMNVGLPFGWKARMASVAFNHQSNGREQPLSRSWNRVIGELAFEKGETTVSLRPWWRIAENGTDDNPQIKDYIGRGELLVTQKWGQHVLAVTARHSLRSGGHSRGSGQIEWAFPLIGGLHGYLQFFSGYGESLIDYNLRQTRVGLGVSVVEWR